MRFLSFIEKGRDEGKMGESIIAALITGVLTLMGTVITVLVRSRRTDEKMKIAQAVTDTKIEELTREVRIHNNFAQRMPVVEEQIKTLNQRVGNIEQKT